MKIHLDKTYHKIGFLILILSPLIVSLVFGFFFYNKIEILEDNKSKITNQDNLEASLMSTPVEKIDNKKEDKNSNIPTSNTHQVEQEVEKLENRIKNLENENKQLKISGKSDIGYENLIGNVVQIECETGTGSGTVISPNKILTNFHVVDGYDFCIVGFTTDPSVAPDNWVVTEVVLVDPDLDRAVLEVDSDYAQLSIEKCHIDNTQISDEIIIIGYPGIGGETLTITNGIISGFIEDYIKTSAKINPGNSGGAAIHESGCYLGIPTAYVRDDAGSLGYIIDEREGQTNKNTSFQTKEEYTDSLLLESKQRYNSVIDEMNIIIDYFDDYYSRLDAINEMWNSDNDNYSEISKLYFNLGLDFENLSNLSLEMSEEYIEGIVQNWFYLQSLVAEGQFERLLNMSLAADQMENGSIADANFYVDEANTYLNPLEELFNMSEEKRLEIKQIGKNIWSL